MSELIKLQEMLSYSSKTGVFKWKINRKGSRGIGSEAGYVNTHYKTGKKYIFIHTLGRQWRAHRLAWLFHYGKLPSYQIDHINGNGTDNRIANDCNTGNSRHASSST